MAIIIENETICPICNDILNLSKEYILTPPLISNQLDELYKLSDTGIHTECLEKYYLKDKLLRYMMLHEDYSNKMRLLMSNNGANDVLGFNLLCSNEKEPLSKFNYFILLKKDISNWNNLDEFNDIAIEFIKEDKWKSPHFNYLKYLIEIVNN